MLVVGPNLSLDETIAVPELRVGTIHRVGEILRLAGGKGANVARALGVLGGAPLLVGFAGGAPGALLARYLDADGIAHRLVRMGGATRTCFTIADASSGAQTEFYGAGTHVSQDEVAALLQTVAALLDGHAWVVLTGSLPPGAPEDLYAQLIELARQHGVRALLDARGAALRAGIAAHPDIVKVNARELSDATETSPHTPAEVAACAAQLTASGISATLTTLGREGAVLVTPDRRWHIRAPAHEVVSPVGSGDAAAAAMIAALEHGGDLLAAGRAAVAAGTANALHLGAGCFTRAEFDAILTACVVTELV
jgi:1-phosphofructokinase family hexose kinase